MLGREGNAFFWFLRREREVGGRWEERGGEIKRCGGVC